MKRWLAALIIVVGPFLLSGDAADEPVLARLMIRLDPERMEAFTELYERELRPMLLEAGFRESGQLSRPAVEPEWFCRLFEVESIKHFEQSVDWDLANNQWPYEAIILLGEHGSQQINLAPWLTSHAATFHHPDGPSDTLRMRFQLYSAPMPEPEISKTGPGHYRFERHDASNGLRHASVSPGLFQNDGALWAMSDHYVWTQFDGQRWQESRIPGLEGDNWRHLLTDSAGNHWFCRFSPSSKFGLQITGDRLAVWNGRSTIIRSEEDGLPGMIQSAHSGDSGSIWINTDQGAVRLDGQSFGPPLQVEAEPVFVWSSEQGHSVWLINEGRTSLYRYEDGIRGKLDVRHVPWLQGASNLLYYRRPLADASGHLWVGTSDGLYTFDGEQFHPTGLFVGEGVEPYLLDSRGDLWVVTWDEAWVYRVESPADDDRRRISRYSTLDGLSGNIVTDVIEDAEGSVWLSTNGGVSRFDPSLRTLTSADGLFSDEITNMSLDEDGRLWMTSREHSLGTYLSGNSSVYPDVPALGALVALPDGGLLVSDVGNWGSASLGLITGGRIEGFGPPDGISGDASGHLGKALLAPGGTAWMARAFGIISYDGKNLREHRNVSQWNFGLAIDRDGAVWSAAGRGGVSVLENDDPISWPPIDGLDSVEVWSVQQGRDGDMWFGTYGSGLLRYDGETFHHYTVKDGLVTLSANMR